MKCKSTGLFSKHIPHFCCCRQFGNCNIVENYLKHLIIQTKFQEAQCFTVIRLSLQGSMLDNLPLSMVSVFINTLQNNYELSCF